MDFALNKKHGLLRFRMNGKNIEEKEINVSNGDNLVIDILLLGLILFLFYLLVL